MHLKTNLPILSSLSPNVVIVGQHFNGKTFLSSFHRKSFLGRNIIKHNVVRCKLSNCYNTESKCGYKGL